MVISAICDAPVLKSAYSIRDCFFSHRHFVYTSASPLANYTFCVAFMRFKMSNSRQI